MDVKEDVLAKLEIYNCLPLLKFAASYCTFLSIAGSAVLNAWITLLMISFGTTYFMDRFIWLIPLFMALLIKPYVSNIISSSLLCKVYLKARTIAFLYLFAALGTGLIIYSPQIN